MKHRELTILSAAALILSGCLPSLSPWYEANDVVFDKEFAGEWRSTDKKDTTVFIFEANGPARNDYRLTITERGTIGKFTATLFKLGDHLLLDLFPDGETLEAAKVHEIYQSAHIAGHLLMKVTRDKDSFSFRMLNSEKVSAILEKKPSELAHLPVKEQGILLMAKTAELQAFLRAHTDAEKLWVEPGKMKRVTGEGNSASKKK